MHPVIRAILQGGTAFVRIGRAYFDGAGDYLSVGAVADWNFLHQLGTTGKWTIERLFRAASFSSPQTLFDTSGGSTVNSGIFVSLSATRAINVQIMRGVNNAYVINYATSAGVFPNDTTLPHHIEIDYDQSLASNNLKIFVDGALVGQATKTANAPSASNCFTPLKIGTFGAGLGEFMNGYNTGDRIADLVRHTEAFSPPSEFEVDSANVKLCMRYSEALGATTFIDDTGKTVTTYGNTIIVA